MLGKLLKVVGVGALIGGTAAALHALNKKQKEAAAAADELLNGTKPIEAEAVEVESEPKVMDKVKTQIDSVKKSIKDRPARMTGKDWYDKGLALLEAEEDENYMLKAKECFENASGMGYVEATRMLAEMYAQGYGVEQDRVTSFELYREAAEKGDEESWTQLGTCYAEGVGTEINPVDAFYWFAMAAAAGDETAKEILGDLAEDITEHVDYPLELVRDWYEAKYDDLTEEESEAVEEFWENCEDDFVELDTDFFADEDVTYIITDNGDEEEVDVEIDEDYTECDAECDGECCEEVEEETTCCKAEELAAIDEENKDEKN